MCLMSRLQDEQALKRQVLSVAQLLVYPRLRTALKRCRLLAHVHCFPSSCSVFEALIHIGLPQRNISIFPKPYSQTKSGIRTLTAAGFDIFTPDDSRAIAGRYDDWVKPILTAFVRRSEPKNADLDYTILLDDGGQLTDAFQHEFADLSTPFASVQATASGVKGRAGSSHLEVLVGLAKVKRTEEYPEIAAAALRRLEDDGELQDVFGLGIVGTGHLGRALAKVATMHGIAVRCWDRDPGKRATWGSNTTLADVLTNSELIAGCCGADISNLVSPRTENQTTLFSMSSRDIEFSTLLKPEKFELDLSEPKYPTIEIERPTSGCLRVLNAGFPVNFDREKEREKPEKVAITRSLHVAGVMNAVERLSCGKTRGAVHLPKEIQELCKWQC